MNITTVERLKTLDSDKEYGEGFKTPYFGRSEVHEKVMALAIHSANKQLPIGTVFEIRIKRTPERDKSLDETKNKEAYQKSLDDYHEQIDNWAIGWYCVVGDASECDRDITPLSPLFRMTVREGQKNYGKPCSLLPGVIARIKVEPKV